MGVASGGTARKSGPRSITVNGYQARALDYALELLAEASAQSASVSHMRGRKDALAVGRFHQVQVAEMRALVAPQNRTERRPLGHRQVRRWLSGRLAAGGEILLHPETCGSLRGYSYPLHRDGEGYYVVANPKAKTRKRLAFCEVTTGPDGKVLLRRFGLVRKAGTALIEG